VKTKRNLAINCRASRRRALGIASVVRLAAVCCQHRRAGDLEDGVRRDARRRLRLRDYGDREARAQALHAEDGVCNSVVCGKVDHFLSDRDVACTAGALFVLWGSTRLATDLAVLYCAAALVMDTMKAKPSGERTLA
jgi:hypothetical protein